MFSLNNVINSFKKKKDRKYDRSGALFWGRRMVIKKVEVFSVTFILILLHIK